MIGLTLGLVVLASGSASRRAMFEAAGIRAVLDKPDVDEDALKRDSAGLSAESTAARLARAKVDAVASRHAGSIIIGGDQMLECDGEWFDKPVGRAGAAEHLRRLSGRTHRLISAAIAIRDGQVLWEGIDTAELTMRPLSADFIDAYLNAAGERVLSSVGAYQVEGLGIQLFSDIRGNHFTILGLPLLPLLDVLRREGVLKS